MGQHGTSGVRAVGLSPRFKHAARLLLLLGVLLMVTGLFAESAGASSLGAANARQEPRLTSHRATFNIPANNPPNREWVLSLWNITGVKQRLLGKDSGTAGKLVVKVPATPGCDFQVDVFMRGKFYSGFKRQLTDCGKTAPTTTTTKPITTTTKPVTTTTNKPKTTGSTGGSTGSTATTVSTKSGGGGGSATTQPVTTTAGGQLAFTGAGLGMWLTAALGALLILVGALMLLYASRYTRAA
jgi:hypothetical protein